MEWLRIAHRGCGESETEGGDAFTGVWWLDWSSSLWCIVPVGLKSFSPTDPTSGSCSAFLLPPSAGAPWLSSKVLNVERGLPPLKCFWYFWLVNICSCSWIWTRKVTKKGIALAWGWIRRDSHTLPSGTAWPAYQNALGKVSDWGLKDKFSPIHTVSCRWNNVYCSVKWYKTNFWVHVQLSK